jgi:cytoskeleton protein RodZ
MFERNRIAETLRSAREKQGMTLEQAAQAAGIPLQYVRLLEGESNVRVGVSDELYLIPFFRKYARFVGIDAEEMLPEFLGIVQQIPGEGTPPVRLAYRPRLGFLWGPLAVIVTIAIAVFLMLRQSPERPTFDDATSRNTDEGSQTAEGSQAAVDDATPPVSEPAATPGAAQQAAVVAASPAPSASVVPAVTPTAVPSTAPSPGTTGAHMLTINAVEEAWLSLVVGDQPAKQYLLRAGESRSWSADHFTLTVGNAGGVSVAVDGTELPPIGRPGRVVRNLRLPAPDGPTGMPAASPSPSNHAQ